MEKTVKNSQIELALNELRTTQRIIFDAVELANQNFGKPVLISEIIAVLTKQQLKNLENAFIVPLNKAIRNTLYALKKRNLLFVAQTERRWNYYAVVTVFDPRKTKFVYKSSFREKLIGLIREAILYYKRAVRVGDIEKYLDEVRPDLKGDLKWFRAAIHRLTNEGIIEVVEKVRQDKFGGNYFLLPDMDKSLYAEVVPPSWLELVLQAFRELWNIQTEKAGLSGNLPKPITTEEIKKYIIEKNGKEAIPGFRGAMPYALWVLARNNSRTEIRRIPCEVNSKHLWVPLNVSDDEIDLFDLPVSDSVKLNSLVRLAVERLNRPITMIDLAEELKIHPELKIKRKKSINSLLNNQSKCTDVKKIGWQYGEWYFYFGDEKVPCVEAYLKLRKIAVEWQSLNVISELDDVENCLVKSIAYGRCMLIQNKIDEIIPLLSELHNDKTLGNVVNFDAGKLLNEVNEAELKLNIWFGDNSDTLSLVLPQNVQNEASGLTVEQLWKLLQPLYPKAVQVKKVAEISNILSGDIRRFKNPNYKPSFCDGSLETAQYLFDKTDAFTYAGQKWGESECFMQAAMVRDNLGLLRDLNFILPALSSTDHNERLVGVSCLAFLQDQSAIEYLFHTCLNDPDAGVRESAIWAYSFLGGNIKLLAAEVRKGEKNEKVLEFLAKVERRNFAELWFI